MQNTDQSIQNEPETPTAIEALEATVEMWPDMFYLRELTKEEQKQRKKEWSTMKDSHCAAIECLMAQGGGLRGSSEPTLGDVKVVSFVTPPKGFLNEAGKRNLITSLERMTTMLRGLVEES